ncbi:hypothetical protein OHA70_34230 [Kribbella sp. NBC_00382]|uniref:hypothetical protein n=1 Tax=Kribbella sp. NBC_00382 TaxID=2975967 RepID=UPI002E1E98CB
MEMPEQANSRCVPPDHQLRSQSGKARPGITKLRRAVEAQGAVLRLIAPAGGTIKRARTTHIDTTAPGILLGESIAKPFTTDLINQLGLHRAWDRAQQVMAQ